MLDALLKRLRGRPSDPSPKPEDGAYDYARLEPLGPHRLRLLSCCMADRPNLPGYLPPPPPNADLLVVFRDYAKRMSALMGEDEGPLATALVAALRMMAGERAAIAVILDNLPTERVVLDQGAGYCMIAPYGALRAALPLPADFPDAYALVEGSQAQARLRAWLEENGDALHWDEAAGAWKVEVIDRR